MTSTIKRDTHEHPYPDVFHPAAPHPYYHMHPLFKPSSLKDVHGITRSWEELRGKSVALYFGDYRSQKCHNFLPHLLQFYKSLNEAGDLQKIEIIFVSLDGDEQQFQRHRARQPWLSVDFSDELITDFKQHFRVMNLPEIPKFGYGPRTGPPTMIVIGSDGRSLQHLQIEQNGPKALLKWDFVTKRF
eukprot:CAMPEP_0113847912 /NCGR_PEP_ID=MMETSP0372-20130328/2156_1 /TAXON_ID=340204 /ORGANISM="Lankesteria abbotti" /LENGTH=186 /DNA_ID=CAMNT_0000817279 /DNA_START=95 /DNA_END=655 /DNA_ORIENTATION=+ /assembly_acc=CAM_ASM_000359